MEFGISNGVIANYSRLNYTPWHALAEFVDNSTQSYFDHKQALDEAYQREGERLAVRIVYDKDNGVLRIADNAMGMSHEELERAMQVGVPPANTTGRSQYGMGMKTAACWFGNTWEVITKKLGEPNEYRVHVDVNRVAGGNATLEERAIAKEPDQHYTIIEIEDLNVKPAGRTIGKIREFLSSMYREDFRSGLLELWWDDKVLTWEELDHRLLIAVDGTPYKKPFKFQVNGKEATGWVGVLAHGSRADAGFAVLHRNRVIQGWPNAWRPQSIFGQFQGSNDLINQRLVGEIHLDDFGVSHTKDAIMYADDEEDQVERGLSEIAEDYVRVARDFRKHGDRRGPSQPETQTAVKELEREIRSPEMVDRISVQPNEIDSLAPVFKAAEHQVVQQVVQQAAQQFRATIGDRLIILLYLEALSPNDPYVLDECPNDNELIVIVNTSHPHWTQLQGSSGVLNYLRHCTYDAVAEWQAGRSTARIEPDTVKMLKDRLLRVELEIERHEIEFSASE